MSIEIKGLDSASAGRTETGTAAAVTKAAAPEARASATAATSPVGDTVQLTDAAQELSRLEAQVRSAPEVDSRRVEQLRAAIQNGSYKVDTGAVATSLLKSEAYVPNESP